VPRYYAEDGVSILDDAMADPLAYRARALAATFRTVSDGAATFHGIAPGLAELGALIEHRYPGFKVEHSFFRKSPSGQIEPHFIHCDRSMGEWSAVLYLTPNPPAGDGTMFWQRTDTEAIGSDAVHIADYAADAVAWFDMRHWMPRYRVAAKFNRLLLFPSRLYHSRALADNYGDGDEARLIQMVFGGLA
jgi:hypothetical protein